MSPFLRHLFLIVTLLFSSLPARPAPAQTLPSSFDAQWAFADKKLRATIAMTPSADVYPYVTNDEGGWFFSFPSQPTSGHFPGALWLMYAHTDDPFWKARAEEWQVAIDQTASQIPEGQGVEPFLHGSVQAYTLTGRDLYRQVVLQAAAQLSTLYNPTTGAIHEGENLYINTLRNMELLFWAATHGGNRDHYILALNHALRNRDFIREDGSVYQLAKYDLSTGALLERSNYLSYNRESTLARSQARAMHGFSMAYRETGAPELLQAARLTADYYLTHLPADAVPYWDFQAPNIPNEPKDSAAAAIAASALIELSRLEPDSERSRRYLRGAEDMLRSLSSPAYQNDTAPQPSILLHGFPDRRQFGTDAGLIIGDYYYLQALTRYQDLFTGTFEGRVIDARTGLGIAGAAIQTGEGQVQTDANGAFRIPKISVGKHAIIIEAAGYGSLEQTVTITAATTTTATFVLSPLPAVMPTAEPAPSPKPGDTIWLPMIQLGFKS